MKIVGIDLAGSEKRNTGFCVLNENLFCKTKILKKDREIIEEVKKINPDLISIDAPLSLPKGRKSLADRKGPHLRECDKALAKMGIKFFPLTLGPMRKLTKRGIRLKKIFNKMGYEVIESFPGAMQDILKIPRKQRGIEKLRKGLMKIGIKGDVEKEKITHDELDAICCALVGKLYLQNDFLRVGDPKEGVIILPKIGLKKF